MVGDYSHQSYTGVILWRVSIAKKYRTYIKSLFNSDEYIFCSLTQLGLILISASDRNLTCAHGHVCMRSNDQLGSIRRATDNRSRRHVDVLKKCEAKVLSPFLNVYVQTHVSIVTFKRLTIIRGRNVD